MQVEIHDRLKNTIKIPATRVVISDDFGNPLVVAVRVDNGSYVAATAANKNFLKILKMLGIDRTLVVEHLDVSNLKPLI